MHIDDLVCYGDIKLVEIASIQEKYEIIIKKKKSASFRKKQKGIPLYKTYFYLVTKFNYRDLAVGKAKVISHTKARVKQLSRIAKKIPQKTSDASLTV